MRRHGENGGGGGINRRRFLAAGCLAAASGGLAGAAKGAGGRLRLRLVYVLHGVKQERPDWPNAGFDFTPVMERTTRLLTTAFPEMEFLPVTAKGPGQAMRILAEDGARRIDGDIVYQLNNWNVVAPIIAGSGKPVLFVDFKYGGTGGFLVFTSLFQRLGFSHVGFVSSSEQEDLLAAVRCFQEVRGRPTDFGSAVARVRRARTPAAGDLTCLADPLPPVSPDTALRRMRESKILAVGYPGVSLWGIEFVPVEMISFAELNRAWRAAERGEAEAVARGWQERAEAVEEVSRETLVESAAMYLGMKALLKKRGANAITVNCLAGFYSGRIPAYPCLGFHELLNQGLVGACECDVRSAAAMIAVNALTAGRPGYISDPVLDTSQRRIIYAHCVASNRPFGPEGPANPFQILTHSEDRKGASVRSLLPAGYLTTTLEFAPERRQVLIHQAKTTGNDPDDRACRTKLVAEPIGDFEKFFTHWDRWGWHRVTVYGDLKERVCALAERMKYKVVYESEETG